MIANLIFLFGFALAMMPWYVKNYSEAKMISVNALLGGSGGTTLYNYEQFKTKKELEIIKNETT